MAQQLTHVELEKLSYIGPEEFVQAFAKDNLDACYKDLKKTSNLECYIQWFNRLSYLVATHACMVSRLLAQIDLSVGEYQDISTMKLVKLNWLSI